MFKSRTFCEKIKLFCLRKFFTIGRLFCYTVRSKANMFNSKNSEVIIMAIGERIKFFRKLNGMTQRELGERLGFVETSADIRVAQYESGKRTPKQDIVDNLAKIFDIDPATLSIPNVDSQKGLMKTFFALEDIYGLTVEHLEDGGVAVISNNMKVNDDLFENLFDWASQSEKHRNGEISDEQYNEWRYKTSEFNDYGMVRELQRSY